MKVISNSLAKLLSASDVPLAQSIIGLRNDNETVSDKVSCVTLRDINTLSFLPANKPVEYNSDGKWTRKNRQSGKIGKVLRKICVDYGVSFTDADIERLTNNTKTAYIGGRFEVVSGDGIAYWYDERRYKSSQGSLSGSCMRNMDASVFDVYTQNESIVKMLILTDSDNMLIGRALLWSVGETIIMDRIYGNDVTVERFKKYAAENGYYHKPKQNYEDCQRFISGDKTIDIEVKLNISIYAGDNCPYIDTFKYVKFGDYISNVETCDCDAVADRTDGYISGCICADCGCNCSEDEIIYVYGGDAVCESCMDNYCFCNQCDEYYRDEDCIMDIDSDCYCEACASRVLYRCDICGDYSTCHTVHTGDYQNVCESCLESEYIRCEACDDYYLIRNISHLEYEQTYVCNDCLSADYSRCDGCHEFINNTDFEDTCPNCGVCINPLFETQIIEKKAI